MRLLVCGSRDWEDWAKMAKWLNWATAGLEPENVVLIEGCANGADRMAERFAKDYGWENAHYPADWARYGKGAGPIRNRQMLIEGKPELVVAFQKKNSVGTQHMVDLAKAAGVLHRVVK